MPDPFAHADADDAVGLDYLRGNDWCMWKCFLRVDVVERQAGVN
jgi:hypothetical protein